MNDLIHRLLEHTSFFDGYPRIAVYNEEGVMRGEVTENLYDILKALADLLGEDE
ncbi:hypothetical protein OAF54_00195 [bacterium]|nr:hypothetical protein [bacterium]